MGPKPQVPWWFDFDPYPYFRVSFETPQSWTAFWAPRASDLSNYFWASNLETPPVSPYPRESRAVAGLRHLIPKLPEVAVEADASAKTESYGGVNRSVAVSDFLGDQQGGLPSRFA